MQLPGAARGGLMALAARPRPPAQGPQPHAASCHASEVLVLCPQEVWATNRPREARGSQEEEEVKIYLTGFDPSASRSEQFDAEWDDYVGILWLERPEDAHEQGADANITWNPRRMWLEEGAIQAAYEAMPAWARGWDVVIIHTASDPGKPPQWELHRHAWQGRILPAKWQYALPEDDDPSWRECSKPTGTSGNSGMWRPRRVALAFRTP